MARAGMARFCHLTYVLLSFFFGSMIELWFQPKEFLNSVNHTLMVMTAISPALFTHSVTFSCYAPSAS
jgi:hypothetical protein